MGERDESSRTEFGVKRDHRSIENRSGGTHPGAEHGTMRGSIMMGMVSGMLDQLRLSQSADGRKLKKSASFVLASFRGSTYRSVRLASALAAA